MRQLETIGSPQTHRQVLACLAPWMDNLSFAARWEGNFQASCSYHLHQTYHWHQTSRAMEGRRLQQAW